MNSKYNKWLKGGLLGVLSIFGLTACEDDHFDLKSTTAKYTLWENISSNDQLKDFASILEQVPVTRSEQNKESGLVYADLLKSSQTFTVWAPIDGTYNADSIKDLIASGKAYDVEKEFVRNHMSRFNYPGVTPETLDILLMNTKKCDFVVGGTSTFKNVDLLPHSEFVPSTNGSLHLINGAATYAANMYEKLRSLTDGDTLALISQYILENDTTYFLPSASTPGGTYNGKIHYIDSVFYTGSKLGFGFINYMTNEDSLYCGAYLSNSAWNEAIDRMSKYFKYKDSYPYMEGTSVRPRFQRLDADSMAEVTIRRTIMNNMFVSLNSQPGFDPHGATKESVKRFIEDEADSLIFMSGEVMPREAFVDVYKGNKIEEASNGFYYILDRYNYVANKTWQLDRKIEAENTYFYVEEFGTTASMTTYAVNAMNRNDTISGIVSNGSIARFSGSGNHTVTFKIRGLLSGRYKVSIVMAPENIVPLYATNPDKPKPSRFQTNFVYDYYAGDNANPIETGYGKGGTKDYYENDITKMDTIVLYENLEIPYAYQGVDNGYLKLQLKSTLPTRPADRRKYTPNMYVDCILIESLGDVEK